MSDQGKGMDERQLEKLLRQVGARTPPPADVAAEVRANVHAAWQAEVERKRYGNLRITAIAASILVTMVAGWYVLVPTPGPVTFATAQSVVGEVRYRGPDETGWQRLSPNALLTAAEFQTGADSYLNLELSSGTNIRLDENSRLGLDSIDQAGLESGAVYVDSDSTTTADIDVRTQYGVAREIGTRFEVRVAPTGWQVQVRDGQVLIADEDIDHLASAGQRVQITADDAMSVSSVAANDPSWLWVERAAAPFQLEGATLHQYLQWVSVETGNPVTFTQADVEQSANQTILHGSIDGLSPSRSLDVVLATTDFQRVSSGEDTITIGK